MKLNLLDTLLGKKKENTQPLSTAELLKQIMEPTIICDSCFYDGRESNVTVKGTKTKCNTCNTDLDKIMINEGGAQLAFYLPFHWTPEQRKAWVAAWKQKNFAV